MTSGCGFCCQLGKLDVHPCLWLPCDEWTCTKGRVWIRPSGSQPSLVIMVETLLVHLESLQTNLAAVRCTASNLFLWSCLYGAHTEAQYSNLGCTKALYAVSFTFWGQLYRFLRRSPRTLFALVAVLFT